MEKKLKDLLIMFKTEQDYAERKNQVIFIVLGILATASASVVTKISEVQLYVLMTAFISVTFTILGGFFPQGKIVKPFSWTIKQLALLHSRKNKKKSSNYLNYANWKNFELNELSEAMIFFQIPVNEVNKNFCEQILTTTRIIYLKYLYFQWTCTLLGLWTIVIILVFTIL